MEKSRLFFRRQFLLARGPISELASWKSLTLENNTILYAHPDLPVEVRRDQKKAIVLIGYLFDHRQIQKGNADIIDALISSTSDFSTLRQALKNYAGQYAIIYLSKSEFNIIHDALGLREVYYCCLPNRVICGSQPNILKKFADPPLRETVDERKRRFFQLEMKQVRQGRFWVGPETIYDGVFHLYPNHYLDLINCQQVRYWPDAKLLKRELEEVIELACAYLQNILKAAANRFSLMMAVTAGYDTRTLLAASREISDQIYYFINRIPGLTDNHPDIYIPSNMFKRIGLPFHIHEIEGEIDRDFRDIFFENTFFASESSLPVIYNVYYKNHSHRVNVLGVGEIGRSFFGRRPRKLDGYFLARALKYKDSVYAVNMCQKWLDESLTYAEDFGVDIMTLLLWEQLLGNWGAVGNSESDIAIDEFDPFDSHYIYELLLSIDPRYSKYSDNLLFKEMIRKMWSELLEFPINPPSRFYDKLRYFLIKYNLFSPLRNLVYSLDRLKYKLKHQR
ncbi:MAG: hypothetical protein ACPLPQ_06355 [Candidatus Saccharicenans sp.]